MGMMNVSKIMDLIDNERLVSLGELCKIDKANNKITGRFIVKSFVKSILDGRKLSLRSMELICNKNKDLSGLLNSKDEAKKRIDHSSLGKRLEKINCDYFKAIYEDLVQKYNNKFTANESKSLHRFDSTIMSLSGKLLKDGINAGGKESDRHIKITIGLKRSIPSSIRLCTSQAEVNEDVALAKAINEAKVEKEDVLLFDRGISSAETFQRLDQEEKKFVTRIKQNRLYHIIKTHPITAKNATDKLDITSDEIVNLYAKGNRRIYCELRLIRAKNEHGEELYFLTNIAYLEARDICEMYKRRWDIEVFFKFIKQNLQITHFISHNKNGMIVYIYCILIAAILFTIFKLTNKLTGFKLPLLQFTLELEKEIIKDIVLFCGGNPNLVDLKL
jgi:transposase